MTKATNIFTAIVLAGSRSSSCPVAALMNEEFKALVPIDGIPMVSRVVTTLKASNFIKDIIIVFDNEDALRAKCPDLFEENSNTKISIVACGESICDSVKNGIQSAPNNYPYLVTTADHALLTTDIVNYFCEKAYGNADLAVGFVEKRVIEQAQPNSKRTYLPFKDVELSGANLFSFLKPESAPVLDFWKKVEQQRKKPWKLFAAFGLRNVFGLVFKLFTAEKAFERASRKLKVSVKHIEIPNAEAAIDVDSVKDYHQVTTILQNR